MAIVNSITGVFSAILTWLLGALGDVMPLFYEQTGDGGQLTFIGVLAVMGVGIALTLLVINTVRRFLRFK